MMQPDNPLELSPWAVVNEDDADGSLALWRISVPRAGASREVESGELALAIFSTRDKAEEYSTLSGSPSARIVHFDEMQTLQVLMAGYQQGIRYAALDPGMDAARQIFVLRDVLKAARHKLSPGNPS